LNYSVRQVITTLKLVQTVSKRFQNGFKTVLSQYPDLIKVASEVANWDGTQGYTKMQSILQANPNIKGVISGNDDMALGAIAALKEAGKLSQVKIGGFDGSPDAANAILNGEMEYFNQLQHLLLKPFVKRITSSKMAILVLTQKNNCLIAT